MKNKKFNAEPLTAVVDVGNAGIRVLAARYLEDGSPELVGIGEAPAAGINEGMVVDIEQVVASLQQAHGQAQLMADCAIDGVLASVADANIHGMLVRGEAVISDNDVTVADVEKVREMARAHVSDSAVQVLSVLERDFEIDSQRGIRQPLGMSGRRMSGNMHLVVARRQSLENMEKCIVRSGMQLVNNFVFAGMAAAAAVLSKDEKELGVCLVDIGAGTTKIVIYADGVVCNTSVVNMGANDIHHDVARMHHASLDDAERVKRRVGVLATEGEEDSVALTDVGGDGEKRVSCAVVRDTIYHRADEILDNIAVFIEHFENDDQESGKRKLSAGIVFVGDGALLNGFTQVAEQKLRHGVRIGLPRYRGAHHELVARPRFAVGMGLLMKARAMQSAPRAGAMRTFFESFKRLWSDE